MRPEKADDENKAKLELTKGCLCNGKIFLNALRSIGKEKAINEAITQAIKQSIQKSCNRQNQLLGQSVHRSINLPRHAPHIFFLHCHRRRATPAATLGLGLVNRSNSFQNNRQQSLLPPVLRPGLWELLRERHLVASVSGMCLGRENERSKCARGQSRCQKGARCT